jgi:hypothetical protein
MKGSRNELIGLAVAWATAMLATGVILWDTAFLGAMLAALGAGAVASAGLWLVLRYGSTDAGRARPLGRWIPVGLALIWGAVLLASGLLLRGTPHFAAILPLLTIWGVLFLIFDTGSNPRRRREA